MKKVKKPLVLFLKGFLLVLLLVIVILAISIPYSKSSEKEMEELGVDYQKIVLTGVHILPMTEEKVLYNKNVYIDRGIIKKITADTVPLLDNFKVIKTRGKYLMPGIIEMHAHIFDRTDLPQYLSYGVTTVRNMMGFPMHLRWRNQLKQNTLLGSNLITATPTINSGNNAGPFHKTVKSSEEITSVISEYALLGYDFIKVYDDLDSLQLEALEQIARQKNIKIAGHPPKISLDGLLNSSIISIEHTEELLKFLDEERSEKSMRILAKKIKASGKAITLNLLAFNRIYRTSQEGIGYYKDLSKKYINPVIRFIGSKQLKIYTNAGPNYKEFAKSKYQAMEKLSRILVEEGVTVLFGTDSGPNFIAPGISIFEEMKLLEKAGISKFEILKSATLNAGEILNDKRLGKVTVNATADLLVLNENPMDNLKALSNPEMLLFKSKYYLNNDLLNLREFGEGKQNIYATIGFFLEHLIKK